jgi:hypothetical protein
MTKREKILVISGTVVVAIVFVGRTVLLRATRFGQLESPSWSSRVAEPSSSGPNVILWDDSIYSRVKNAVRVDVWGGIPHGREAGSVPIKDLVSYIDAAVSQTGAEYVVVSVSSTEKIGDVVTVIDDCRKTHVKTVVLNWDTDTFAVK